MSSRLLLVVLERLAGKAGQQVPRDLDPVVVRPLQQADVLEHRRALAHELEDVRAQALDPGLDDTDPGPRERAQLLSLQVRLDLVEDRVVDARPRSAGGRAPRGSACRGCCRRPRSWRSDTGADWRRSSACKRSGDFERYAIPRAFSPQKVQWCFAPHQQPRALSNRSSGMRLAEHLAVGRGARAPRRTRRSRDRAARPGRG